MVTKRLSVEVPCVNWTDGMAVDRNDMRDEQIRNKDIDAANVHNFFSSGVITKTTTPNIILDTENLNDQQQALLDAYSFDGSNVYIQSNDVSEVIYGVQLSVTLSGVLLDGAAKTKVSIIGDTFGDSLIHDDLTFDLNGTQITRGRYKKIRSIIFKDFAGNQNGSRNYAYVSGYDGYSWVGNCKIVEADSLEVSQDAILASQTAQPNKFFSDFAPADETITITQLLDTAIRSDDNAKSLSDLGIGFVSSQKRELQPNDVTTKIGQKFQVKGRDIQKISVLLSTDGYNWAGDIIMSLYELQTQVTCPVSPTPDNLEDFDPDPRIIGQLALDKQVLEKQGIELNGTPQIVDFVFTDTNISDPLRSPITSEKYYAFTLSRSGTTNIGTILIEEAPHITENGYMIVFDGTQWINIKESDMWFIIYGDYVKVSDGVAYEEGIGIQVPKVYTDENNAVIPYVASPYEFYTVTKDAYNYVIMERELEYSDPVQDQRTGDDIASRVRPIPNFSLINITNLNILLETNPNPLLLACVRDRNSRGNISSISGEFDMIGLVIRNQINMIRPNADLQQNNWDGSLITPSKVYNDIYRIIKTELFNDAYGDVNGDGLINIDDLDRLNDIRDLFLNKYGTRDIDISTNDAQQFIIDGNMDIDEFLRTDVDGNGIINNTDQGLIDDYINKVSFTFPIGSLFSRLQFTVENLLNPLTTDVVFPTAFSIVPFVNVDWQIDYFATWIPDLLKVNNSRRFLPTTLTDSVSGCNGGRNNFFIPGDAIIGGSLKNPDGTAFNMDFEMTQLSLHIPITDSNGNPALIDGYSGILLFDTFVAEENNGKTTLGFNAMKYSDGTYVQQGDFLEGKVKIVSSLQSISNKYNIPFAGSIYDIVGLNYDATNSLMTLYIENGYEGVGGLPIEMSTKILVEIYLKKSGFKNPAQSIDNEIMKTLLGL